MFSSPSFRGSLSYLGMNFREVWSQLTLSGEKPWSMPWKLTLCWKPTGFVLLSPTVQGFNGTMSKGCTRSCAVPESPELIFSPGWQTCADWEELIYLSDFFFLCTENCTFPSLDIVILTHIFYCSVHLQIWGLLWKVKAHTPYVSCGGGGKEAVSDVCCF